MNRPIRRGNGLYASSHRRIYRRVWDRLASIVKGMRQDARDSRYYR